MKEENGQADLRAELWQVTASLRGYLAQKLRFGVPGVALVPMANPLPTPAKEEAVPLERPASTTPSQLPSQSPATRSSIPKPITLTPRSRPPSAAGLKPSLPVANGED